MYIDVTFSAAKFFLDNPDIPCLFVSYEDLIDSPEIVSGKIGEFVGFGDYSNAASVVDKNLNRSKPEDVDSVLWTDAEFVWDAFLAAANYCNDGNREKAEEMWRKIMEYAVDPHIAFNRNRTTWRCLRAKQTVSEVQCKMCMSKADVCNNFRKHSESQPGKHWSSQPCVYECGMDLDRTEHVSIDDSIRNNFWADQFKQ
jgi:hypothetical protein